MSPRPLRAALTLPAVLLAFVSTEAVAQPADPRFFGTYCLAEQKFCKSIPFWPDPCVTISALQVHVDYISMPGGDVVKGSGTLKIDGKPAVVALSGTITGAGVARSSAVVPGLGRQASDLRLSDDGLALSGSYQNRTLTARKDACGNNPPQVTFSSTPGNPVPLGQNVLMSATITDEDAPATFTQSRIQFTSNRQGLLSGWRPAPRSLGTAALLPGTHQITVAVTDSGGLTANATGVVEIVNRPPVARIFLPTEGATLVAGGAAMLKGSAMDPDTGALPDSALSWSAQLTPGGAFVPLGGGSERLTTFAAAADPVVVRLTANDGGNPVTVDRTIRVAANTGNTPPVVVITKPLRGQFSGPVDDGAFAGTPTTFTATASDAESDPAAMPLRWEFTLLRDDGTPDPTPPLPNPPAVTGTLAPTIAFPAVHGRVYRVTITATDAGGLSASDSVLIMVTSQVIL